jgi:Flp pilus assembly protein TadG
MKSKSFSRGQVAVILTLVMVTLLGAIALSTDVAILYLNWVNLQKAADAAALAGANKLDAVAGDSTNATNAQNYAKGYACLNGINDPGNNYATVCPNPVVNASYTDKVLSTSVNGSNTQLTISLQRQVPYFFARVLGMSSGLVKVASQAQVSGPTSQVNLGLFPMGVQCATPCNLSVLNPGSTVQLGAKFSPTGAASGNWQWLSLGGTGAPVLGGNVQNGASGSYNIGQGIASEPGNKGNAGPVKGGFSSRMSSCAPIADPCQSTNPNNIPIGDPCLVVLPAVDFNGCRGRCSMTIQAFANVYIEPSSTSTNISACFVKAITPNSIGSSTAPQLTAISPAQLIN